MTQEPINIFQFKKIYAKEPKKNCITNKTDVYHIDDILSWERLDLKYYGGENYRS